MRPSRAATTAGSSIHSMSVAAVAITRRAAAVTSGPIHRKRKPGQGMRLEMSSLKP